MDNFSIMQSFFCPKKFPANVPVKRGLIMFFDKKIVWREVLESIKVSVSPANFTTWFSQTHLESIQKNNKRCFVEVGCGSGFIKTTIEGRYFGLVQDSLTKTLGIPCDLGFIVKQRPEPKSVTELTAPLFNEGSLNQEELTGALVRAGIRPTFTFENFAVSSSNQMAHAAAEAVAKTPGSAYNPLFIWGGVGVGKTHLMNAIGHFLVSNGPGVKVFCCTGEGFTNDIVEGIRNKTTPEVRNKYRRLKALFVDDVQFIAGKETMQEEFFHTFNALVAIGGQVVLTSDRPPSEIAKLEERLKSRFEAGLIVDVSPPDFELRCAILQIKAKEKGIEIPMDLIQLIAGNIDSARKLEGFLIRLSSETRLKGVSVSQELIESVLGKREEGNGQLSRVSPNELIAAVSKYFSIGKKALLGTSRARPVARPRQILMYLLRTQLSLPLQEVGRLVERDHTTVMHAVEKITHLTSNNVQIRQDIQGIKKML